MGKYAVVIDLVFPVYHLAVYHFCWHRQEKLNDEFNFLWLFCMLK